MTTISCDDCTSIITAIYGVIGQAELCKRCYEERMEAAADQADAELVDTGECGMKEELTKFLETVDGLYGDYDKHCSAARALDVAEEVPALLRVSRFLASRISHTACCKKVHGHGSPDSHPCTCGLNEGIRAALLGVSA